MTKSNSIIIYKQKGNKPAIDVHLVEDTVWLNQKLMSDLFDKDTDTIGLHIRNIIKESELDEKATTEYFSVVQKEGNRKVNRNIKFYNLDMIISVGYRVKSKIATQLRIWATNITEGIMVYA